MSETEEQDFITDCVTWMKGPGVQFESIVIFNFGYERPLPLPSIAAATKSTLSFNLKTSGMHTQSRSSIVVVGKKYVGRFEEIMLVVERIREDTQALPFATFLQTKNEINLLNLRSHHMHESPSLVGILLLVILQSSLLTLRLLGDESHHLKDQ